MLEKSKEDIEFNDLGINLPVLQDIQLEMLIEFDRICQKYDITYQLFAGTLLGAVRHKGFIPWDDDIDVCLLREDYNKFLEACRTELSEEYFLQVHEKVPNKYHSFSRIRKNNTLAVQDAFSEFDIHHGIFIDLFPMDKVKPTTKTGKLQRFLLYKVKAVKYLKIKKEILNTKSLFKKMMKQIVHYLIKPISLKSINRIETKIATMFEKSDTKYITLLVDGTEKEYWRYLTTVEDFKETVKLKFEGYPFLVPRKYDETLKRNFGNYMELPPISERVPHHRLIYLDFDTKNSKGENNEKSHDLWNI